MFYILGLTEATAFLKSRAVPDSWKMDMSEILESSSSDDDGEADGSDGERNKHEEEEAEVGYFLYCFIIH